MIVRRLLLLFCLLFNFSSLQQLAAENEAKDDEVKVQSPLCDIKERSSTTEHRIVIAGKPVDYQAVAGTLVIKDEKCTPIASLFYTYYTKRSKEDQQGSINRPITFCFNGGPGSSSVWLHMGVLGPKRVKLTNDGEALPPYYLIDNEYSLLDKTDLVFIDPMSTGYSQAIPFDDSKKFHGVEEDISLIAEFIEQFISKNNRWESPKFILGESYGTMRAVGLAHELQKKNFIYINGIVLISAVIDFQTIRFRNGNNDLPFLTFFPSYTAAAWYHKKLSPELQKLSLEDVVEASRKFVVDDYVKALFKGSTITAEERKEVISKISRFSALSEDYVDRCNLRLNDSRFMSELLRKERKVIGRFDSRITGIDIDPVADETSYDPSFTNVLGAFTATFNSYIKNDLKFNMEEPYQVLPMTIHLSWDWGSPNEYLEFGSKLTELISYNAFLRVFVGNGYYDLATPFFATEYTFNHLGIESQLQKHITMKYYEGGHMMYTHLTSLKKMKDDLSLFYDETLRQQEREAVPL